MSAIPPTPPSSDENAPQVTNISETEQTSAQQQNKLTAATTLILMEQNLQQLMQAMKGEPGGAQGKMPT